MRFLAIHPSGLDTNGAWLMWPAGEVRALGASLARQGLLTPILVDDRDGRPVLVAGLRRVLAAREIRGMVLSARVLEPDPADADATARAVRRGLAYLASNLGRTVTESMLVAAGRFFLSRLPFSGFVELAGPYLGALFPANIRSLEAWLALPEDFDRLLRSGNLPLSAGPLLRRLAPDDRRVLGPFFEAARWSKNSLSNLVNQLDEAARAAGEPLSLTVARSGLADILAAELSPNDRLARLLAAARRTRLPRLCDIEARFAALSRRLARGGPWRVEPSPGFEEDAAVVSARLDSPAAARGAAAALARMADSPDWARLLTVAGDDGDAAGPAGPGDADAARGTAR